MKLQSLLEAINYASDDPKANPEIVRKFADVDAKHRSYYIMKWAEEKGIDSGDAMFMAGYVQDGYIGAGAWNWRYVGMDESIQEEAIDKDTPCPACGDPKCEHKEEHISEDGSGMIGEPDSYYDAEDRIEAYNELQDALAQSNSTEAEYVKDGHCPECPNVEDDEDCNGFGNYGCDDGELTYMNDTVSWKAIKDHDERQAEKANRGPAPDKETIMKVLPRLHDDYVKSGKYNAMELPGILRQMYPELGKREAAGYTAEFFKTFEESVMHEGQKGEGEVAKMLSKALGDENRWTEMSPYELFAELESQNPEVADMLAKVAKQLYDVKLKERTYKDVGVADVQKDPRGKEFKFDKDSKQFKSQDGELAAINTKVGKDLMKKRKSAMRKSTPSAHKKKAPNRPSLMSQIFRK
ncbi:hypothetical protein OAQ62_01565 [bacterium]|nr:hypothetical protein [bacterium]